MLHCAAEWKAVSYVFLEALMLLYPGLLARCASSLQFNDVLEQAAAS